MLSRLKKLETALPLAGAVELRREPNKAPSPFRVKSQHCSCRLAVQSISEMRPPNFPRRPGKQRSFRLKFASMKCHYSMEGQALRRLVDADIVNRKRERAVDTGEVQAEGVKHETATETKEAVDTVERATSLTLTCLAFCSDRDGKCKPKA